MNIYNQDKTKLVNSVFSKVHNNYDLMNDLMSFGVHRLWKKNLINWMKPQPGNCIIDVAAGTGDLAKMISKKNEDKNIFCCVEPNRGMFETGKQKLKLIDKGSGPNATRCPHLYTSLLVNILMKPNFLTSL